MQASPDTLQGHDPDASLPGQASREEALVAMLIGAVPVPLYPPFRWSQIEEHVRGRAAILLNAGRRCS